jgi:hypothetical protein
MTLSISFHNPVSVSAETIRNDHGPNFGVLTFTDADGTDFEVFFDDAVVAHVMARAFLAATGVILPQTLADILKDAA